MATTTSSTTPANPSAKKAAAAARKTAAKQPETPNGPAATPPGKANAGGSKGTPEKLPTATRAATAAKANAKASADAGKKPAKSAAKASAKAPASSTASTAKASKSSVTGLAPAGTAKSPSGPGAKAAPAKTPPAPKTAAAAGSAAKAAASKTAGTKTAGATKPAATKPAATKPAATKPAATRGAGAAKTTAAATKDPDTSSTAKEAPGKEKSAVPTIESQEAKTSTAAGSAHAPARSGSGLLSSRKRDLPQRRTEGYTEERFINHQRQALQIERATYLEQAKSLRAEAESLVEEMEPGDIQFDDESGEGGTVTVDRERDLALSAQALVAVDEIDHALAKMATNTYGICENCGRLIPKARLEALPYARLDIDCKSGGLSRR
jgi:DnaK suppressor protein